MTFQTTLNLKYTFRAIVVTMTTWTILACRVQMRPPELTNAATARNIELATGNQISGKIVAVGAAETTFVPDNPVALAGFGGPGRRFLPPLFTSGGDISFCKPYREIVNPPRIKVALFNVADATGSISRFQLVSLDTVAVTADMTKKIHAALDAVHPDAPQKSSLSNTIVQATHTHSGPAGLTESALWSAFVCDRYSENLMMKYLTVLGDVTKSAEAKLQPITSIETTKADVAPRLRSRFAGMEASTEVSLISFKTANANIPLSLLQMAVHPTWYGSEKLTLSADLVTPLEATLQNLTGSQEVFLMQTSVGNMDANMGDDEPEAWAQRFGESLLSGGKTTTVSLNTSVVGGYLALPEPSVNWKACSAEWAKPVVSLPVLQELPKKAPFSIWNLNETVQLMLPGEWTTAASKQIAGELQESFPERNGIKIFSLANEYTAYHLTTADYHKVTLESCSSIYGDSLLMGFASELNVFSKRSDSGSPSDSN
ncbi:MAG: hypothetical protein ACO3A4_00695 [Silvanigrellaceae bacterium]